MCIGTSHSKQRSINTTKRGWATMLTRNSLYPEIRELLPWISILTGLCEHGILFLKRWLPSPSKVCSYGITSIICSSLECGITIAHDGSEDDRIHCFKPHGPIPAGLAALKEARESLIQENGILPDEIEEDIEENMVNSLDSDDEIVEN